MHSVPAIPYMTLVKQFALAKGLRFFTWPEMQHAAILYDIQAKLLN